MKRLIEKFVEQCRERCRRRIQQKMESCVRQLLQAMNQAVWQMELYVGSHAPHGSIRFDEAAFAFKVAALTLNENLHFCSPEFITGEVMPKMRIIRSMAEQVGRLATRNLKGPRERLAGLTV